MKFGTSGLRGLVAEMTDAVCAALRARPSSRTCAARARLRGRCWSGGTCARAPPRIAAACRRAIRAEGVDRGRLRRGADAGAGARGGAARRAGDHGHRQPHPVRPQRPEVLPPRRRDHQGRRGRRSLAALAAPPAPVSGPRRDGRTGVGARYVARYVDFFGAGCLRGRRIGVYEHSAAGRDLTCRGAGERSAPRSSASGRTDSFVPIDTEAIAARGRRAHRRLGRGAPARRAGLDRRRRRPPAVADETGAVLRGDAVGIADRAAPRCRRGGDAAQRQHRARALRLVRRVRRTRIGSPYVIEGIEALAAQGARLPSATRPTAGSCSAGRPSATAGGCRRCRPATRCCRCWRCSPWRRGPAPALGPRAAARAGDRERAARAGPGRRLAPAARGVGLRDARERGARLAGAGSSRSTPSTASA